MSLTLAQARKDVHTRFQQILSLSDSDTQASFASLEHSLWSMLLSFGRALLTLFLLRQAQRPRPFLYRFGDKTWHLSKERTTKIGTVCGKVYFTRKVGRIPGQERAAADLPIDRDLGLLGGFSQNVVLRISQLCAQMSFGLALLNFRDIFGWAPSRNAVLRMIDYTGEAAKCFLEQVQAPENEGEILVIEMDAKGTPHMSSKELERRKKPHQEKPSNQRKQKQKARKNKSVSRKEPGRKGHSKNAKMAVVGVIYTLRQTLNGLEGPINKRVIATYEGHKSLAKMLQKDAIKRGYGVKPTLFLGDGSEHIWRCQREYFPLAMCTVDWYHIAEKLWETGRALHPKNDESRRGWVLRQLSRLREGQIEELIVVLQNEALQARSGPGSAAKRAKLAKTKQYLETHKERMKYDVCREWGLIIGTGAVEGAVRNVLGVRQDGSGMRWGRGRDECILRLRCIFVNGQWSEFAKFLEGQEAKKLRAKPIPAKAHDAKAVAA